MGNGIVDELARQYLGLNVDLAKRRGLDAVGNISDPTSTPIQRYASTPAQIMRFSMDNVRETAKKPTALHYADGTPLPGVSEKYKDRPASDFADEYFNNLPVLLDRNAEGYTVPGNSGGTDYISLTDMFQSPDGSEGKYSRLQLLAGEMLALSLKAAGGKASPEELDLLDTYQQFMQSRTGS